MKINPSKPIMVTGATGYVASWLIKKLLDEGCTVHATVRDPNRKEKIQHLDRMAAETPGSIKYFKADLLDDGSFADAMSGCELVYHTASPFTTVVDDPVRDLIEPAVKGTENVLLQADCCPDVKRVVLTSSCAAIYTDAKDCGEAPKGMLTEEVWNTTASESYQPYSYSKTMAEKKAWEIHKAQSRWDLVTINPSLVLGPFLNPAATTSESFNILKQMGDGSFKRGAPNLGMGLVDVRDVATAHYLAGFKESASGRYITSAHNSSFLEMAQVLHKKYGDHYPIPNNSVPKWLLMLLGPMMNKLLTRRYIRNNINHSFVADNSKIQNELGLSFRSLEETLYDSFDVLIESGVLKSAS